MIRLIQRRLIIPRGDTGTFTVPVISAKNTGDVAVFSIIDNLTERKVFEKIVEVSGDTMTIEFSHNDTVNLPVGKYVWDIKFYSNPVFVDGALVNGIEVDSYYAAFTLPICEIRQTGDNLLMADDAPDTELTPSQLNILNATVNETNAAKRDAAASASAAEASATAAASSANEALISANNAANSAINAQSSANEIKNISAEAITLQPDSNATATYNSSTGKLTFGIPRGNGITSAVMNNDYTLTLTYTNGNTFTTPPLKGEQGDAFHIVKTYNSIAAMNADYSGNDVEVGEFVMITSTVEDPDNAKVYVKGDQQYNFVIDMSGASGINGVGINNIQKTSTNGKIDTYTITYTDNTSTTFDIKNGEDGSEYTVLVQSTQPVQEANKIWIPTSNGVAQQVPTVEEMNQAIANIQIPVQDVQIDSTSIVQNGIATIPIANATNIGLVKATSSNGISIDTNGDLKVVAASNNIIKTATESKRPIVPYSQHISTFYGLAKAAGDSTQAASSNNVGVYTDDAKTAIKSMLGISDPTVTDVQANGTSVLSNGVANIPIATNVIFGVVKTGDGLRVNNNQALTVESASSYQIQDGHVSAYPIAPVRQHQAVFYGLAKAARDTTQALSENETGDYTDEAKGKIQDMLGVSNILAPTEGVLASKAYAVGELFTSNGKLYKVTTAIAQSEAIVVQDAGETVSGHNAEETSLSDGFVKKTDYATNIDYGIIKISANNYGLKYLDNNPGVVVIRAASDDNIKNSYSAFAPIVAGVQDKSVFYGLAKASGDITQSSSSNAVGTYTDAAKASIQHMLGTDTNLAYYESDTTADQAYAIGELFMLNGKLHQATAAIAIGDTFTVGINCAVVNVAEVFPHDVQVNGTSVVQDGVANVPTGNGDRFGVVRPHSNAFDYYGGSLKLKFPSLSDIKEGTNSWKALTPSQSRSIAFYGLAMASGDSTQSSSSNEVGTYTESAKSAISQMLNAPVAVSGTTPAITALPGVQYVCGEVATLDITLPASGCVDVVFESGSTPTVLTITPPTGMTVEWANGFDSTALEADTLYELNIKMVGTKCLGVAGQWT